MTASPVTASAGWLFGKIADGRDRARARVLYFFQGTFVAVVLAMVIPLATQFQSPLREQILLLAAANLVFTVAMFVATRSGRVTPVCWLQVMAMWITPFYHMYVEGGLYSNAFIGWPMAIVLANLLLGRAGATVFAALSIAGGLFLTIMWQRALIPPAVVQPPLEQFTLTTVMILVLAAIQWFGSRQFENLELRTKGLQTRIDLLAENSIGEWKWDIHSGKVEWSRNMGVVLGRPESTLAGSINQLRALIFPDDQRLFAEAVQKAQQPAAPGFYVEHRIVDGSGNTGWVENRGRVFFDETGIATVAGGIITRIDERKHIEAEFGRQSERLRLIFQISPIFILVLDTQGKILFINQVENDYSRESIVGKANMLDFLPPESHAIARAAMRKALADDSPVIYDLRGYGNVGKIEWYANRMVRFTEDGETRLLLMSSNITARKEAESRLERLATRDSLTGLTNRHGIMELVDRLIATGARFYLLFIDLDHFKTINDTLGHAIGDQLLIHIAGEIREILGQQDYFARLGGDEFLAVVREEDFETDAAFRARVEKTAVKIISTTSLPHTIGTAELFVSASIGLAFFPDDARTTGELIKFADLAMYEAKQRGRAGYAFFHNALSKKIDERMRIDRLLRGAIDRNELSLHFQPLVDTADGKVRTAEALLRWNPKGQDPISPAVFIPIAEDTGLIRAVGDWVLREACRSIAEWKKSYGKSPRLSINVSARQLERESFAADLQNLLQQFQLQNSDIELELTETSLLSTIHATLPQLMQLAENGIRLVIDDFGTGYSSLSYLKKLPVRALKIDRSFIADIDKDRNDEAIIRAVMAMASGLSLEVVAEGVERRDQLDFLSGLGCHTIQGYLYSVPLSAGEFWQNWAGKIG